jgi:hypothetical protein
MVGGKPEDRFQNQPGQAAETIEAEKVTPEKIIDAKLKNLNIQIDDLNKEIPEFNLLSSGQKVLALENLTQSVFGDLKSDALKEYQGQFSQMTGKGKDRFSTHNAGVLAKNVWLGIAKHYKLAKIEKASKAELAAGGLDIHKEVLAKLTEGLINYGPEAELNSDGRVQINYLGRLEGLSEEEKKIVADFNSSATTWSKIPDDWQDETAKKTDQAKFSQAKKVYEQHKALALNILQEKKGGEAQAVLEMNKIEGQIRSNQFLNSNPDLEAQLLQITDQSLARRIISGVVAERGIYMGAGFASRTIATLGLTALGSLATGVGVVVGAGAIGYIRAKNRAKESLRQKDIVGRRGQSNSNDELAKIFALGGGTKMGAKGTEISFGLSEKIDYLLTRLENEADPEKKIALAENLKKRLDYTKKCVDNRAIDFGSKEERFGNKYNLMTGLIRGEAYLTAVDHQDVVNETNLRRQLHEKFFEQKRLEREEELDQKRKDYIVKQAGRGLIIAMGFGTVGRVIGEFVHFQSEMPKSSLGLKEEVAAANHNIPAGIVNTGPNNPELVNYLVNDPVLKGNLDLKTALLGHKITVDILKPGQGIGSYANVTNDTPVNFVQPDGSIEVHGAGHFYVHPGDRVVQTEDGQIFVIKDSGVKGTEVAETFTKHISPVDSDGVVPVKPKVADLHDASQPLVNNLPKVPSSVEPHDVLDNSGKTPSSLDLKNEPKGNVPTDKGFFSKVKEFLGGKKINEPNLPKTEVPSSFSSGHDISQWNLLSSSDKEVYNNFSANTSLYGTNPNLAITNFLGQKPVEIIRSGTEFSVVLKNGHIAVFDTEDGQIIMNVDNGAYDDVSPDKLISVRKLIQSDNSVNSVPNSVKELPLDKNADIKNNSDLADGPVKPVNDLMVKNNLDAIAPQPNVKVLTFNPSYFDSGKAAQVQDFYNHRLEVLAEIQKQYDAAVVKYAGNPRLEYFASVVKTYGQVESTRVQSIIEGSQNPTKFTFNIDEALKEKQNPKLEVSEHMKRVISAAFLKKS